MAALILEPTIKEDADLIMNLAQKMHIKFAMISDEDYALDHAMLPADETQPALNY